MCFSSLNNNLAFSSGLCITLIYFKKCPLDVTFYVNMGKIRPVSVYFRLFRNTMTNKLQL